MSSTTYVAERYESALAEAHKKLAQLDVVRGRAISLKGLRGWIFEQTVRTCLEEEMKKRGIFAETTEQAPISGRSSVDLLVGPVAIEIKAGGFFQDVGERYYNYRKIIEAKGWHYFYLTLVEGYAPYVKIAQRAFGKERAFFLDQKGEWDRFLARVMPLLKTKAQRSPARGKSEGVGVSIDTSNFRKKQVFTARPLRIQ